MMVSTSWVQVGVNLVNLAHRTGLLVRPAHPVFPTVHAGGFPLSRFTSVIVPACDDRILNVPNEIVPFTARHKHTSIRVRSCEIEGRRLTDCS